MATSQLVLEQRRQYRINFALMVGCLAAGIAVSNERGVFVPPHSLGEAFAATARAFAAIVAPPGQLQLQPYNLLFNPNYANPNALPGQIAQRIFNPPAPPANNPFPGVFPAGAAAPAEDAGPVTGNGAAPAQGGGVAPDGTSGGALPPAVPGANGGFTGVPVPVTDLGTDTPPTINPGGTGTTPGGGTTTPGGGTTTPGDGTTTPGGGTTTPGGGTTTPGGGTTTPGGGTTTPGGGTTTPGGGTTTPGGGTITPGGGTTTPGGGTTTPCIGAACGTVTLPTEPTGPTSPVPEPASWATLILGFGIVGGLQRWVSRKKRPKAV